MADLSDRDGAAQGPGCLGDAGRVGRAEAITTCRLCAELLRIAAPFCKSRELPPWVGLPSPLGLASLTLGQVKSWSSEGNEWWDCPWLCNLEQVTTLLWAAVFSLSSQEVD